MGAPRFFVAAELAVGQLLPLPTAAAHHAQHALRLAAGATITLFNGRGGEFVARLVPGRVAAAEITGQVTVERELAQRLVLVQAQVSREQTDWIVEKATELGAVAIVLAPAARSVVRLDAARADARRSRAVETARAACEQCGRNRVPTVEVEAGWISALERAALLAGPAAVRLLLDPGATGGLDTAGRAAAVAIAVGPEGGLSAEESAAAGERGWIGARLGPTVLRTETAGLAVLAALAALHQAADRAAAGLDPGD